MRDRWILPWHCADCITQPPLFEASRSYGEFDGVLRELLHWFKFRGIDALATPLGERMVAAAPDVYAECQAIVAVPLDTTRKRERGYNQAALLAGVAARRMKLPLLPTGALRRTRPTAPQSGLTRLERRENVYEAFSADRKSVSGRTVLVIDDVMTTGATLDACARALASAGATKVFALTVARTPVHELR